MRTLVYSEKKTLPPENNQSLSKNFTVGSSTSFSRPRSISSVTSSDDSVADILYDSDEGKIALSVSS